MSLKVFKCLSFFDSSCIITQEYCMQSKIEDMKLYSRKSQKLSYFQSKSKLPKDINSFDNWFDFDLVGKDTNSYFKSATKICIKVHNTQLFRNLFSHIGNSIFLYHKIFSVHYKKLTSHIHILQVLIFSTII